MIYPDDLKAHLAGGATTLSRCFAVTRKDGVVLGFTDHDRDLVFDGISFRAESGMTAKAIQQGTGLSVDNSEAFGALKSDAIVEEDILAGRYDGAEVRAWLVNWAIRRCECCNFAERWVRLCGRAGRSLRNSGGLRRR